MSGRVVHVWVLRGRGADSGIRAALPHVLREHLGREPRIVRGRGERPRIQGEADMSFSVTHTDGIGLIAVTRGAEVGVDAERLNPRRVDLAVAARFLGVETATSLAALADRHRISAFLSAWTRLEAAAKADGRGLDGRATGRADDAIVDLDLGPEHVGSLAVSDRESPLIVWHRLAAGDRGNPAVPSTHA